MKYGELKIECINEMDEMNDRIDLNNLPAFETDESYFDLFLRMPGSINRAMDRLATKKKLPAKQIVLNQIEHSQMGNFLVFNLSAINDFRSVKRVSAVMGDNFYYIDAVQNENQLFVNMKYANGVITLSYYPKAPAVSSSTEDDDEIDLPDELARLIPYYVKSDLMDRQEPELAAAARNKFESALDEISLNEEDYFTTTIEKDYRICE